MKNHSAKIALFIFFIGILTRLLFLNTNVFFFDGDEAILGVMALELLNGDPSFYFYGQTYGFSFVEVLMISLGVKIFGTTMLAIKIPMLLLWLTAVTFIGLTLQKLVNNRILLAGLLLLLIILSPTWLIWSMKARGGYLTSFLCSSVIIYLVTSLKAHLKIGLWALIGGLFIILWESQPLWLMPTLIIVLYSLIKTYKSEMMGLLKSVVSLIIGALVIYTILYVIKLDLDSVWNTPTPNLFKRMEKVGELPGVLTNNLAGNYFLSNSYSASNTAYSILFLLGFAFSGVITFYTLFKEKKINLQFVFLISSFASFSGFLVKSEPRYLLPFFTFSVLTMALTYTQKKPSLRVAKTILLAIITLTGITQLPQLKEYSFVNMKINAVDKVSNDTEIMEDLVDLLKRENIKYVYSTNEFIQYQLNYLSNHEILTIGRIDRCRTPWNVTKIQEAYNDHKDQFAVIGYNFNYAYTDKIPLVGNKIFYILKPSPQVLEKVGFFKNLEKE